MALYKGRSSRKAIERDFPHHVEIAIPPGGLGKRLDAMHEFCAARGIHSHAFTHRKKGEFSIRWHFADPAMAAAFAGVFDGSIPQGSPAGAVLLFTNTRIDFGGNDS